MMEKRWDTQANMGLLVMMFVATWLVFEGCMLPTARVSSTPTYLGSSSTVPMITWKQSLGTIWGMVEDQVHNWSTE